jgi:hypothetical protein
MMRLVRLVSNLVGLILQNTKNAPCHITASNAGEISLRYILTLRIIKLKDLIPYVLQQKEYKKKSVTQIQMKFYKMTAVNSRPELKSNLHEGNKQYI